MLERCSSRSVGVAAALLCSLVVSVSAPAQSPAEWRREFGGFTDANTQINAAVEYDDGTGMSLFVAGTLYLPVPPYNVTGLAKWDGVGWRAAALGGVAYAESLAVFNDGSGPKLYVAGYFPSLLGSGYTGIASWDGTTLAPVGTISNSVIAMKAYDDGSGPGLFVGGAFANIEGVTAQNLAKWDGAAWHEVGGGVNSTVHALEVQATANGPRLLVGGSFTTAGPIAANYVAAWSGSGWSPVSTGIGGTVRAIAVPAAGASAEIFVGGSFQTVSGQPAAGCARFDGSSWHPLLYPWLPIGLTITALRLLDLGTGEALYFGGDQYSSAYFGVRLANDTTVVFGGLSCSGAPSCGPNVRTLTPFNDGYGRRLFVGGKFANFNSTWTNAAVAFDGATVKPLDKALATYPYVGPPVVRSMANVDGFAGSGLLAIGAIDFAEGVPTSGPATWNGSHWASVGGSLTTSTARCAATFDAGGGPELFVGGDNLNAPSVGSYTLLKWNGANWSPPNQGAVNGQTYSTSTPVGVRTLLVHDEGSGPKLYAGGHFLYGPNTTLYNVGRYDGVGWTGLGNPSTGSVGVNNPVLALASFDDGFGPALFVGGEFTSINGVGTANYVARWNASGWSPLATAGGNGLSGKALCFASFDDGTGPALFVGGEFTSAGGAPVSYVAKWDGLLWHDVGGGVAAAPSAQARVNALEVFDDGTGPALYAGGFFATAGGTPASNLARWNGSTWTAVGGGVAGEVFALKRAAPDGFASLYVGGAFQSVGSGADQISSPGFAAWSTPDARIVAPASTIVGQPLNWSVLTPGPFQPYFFDVSLSGATPGIPVSASRAVPLNPPLLYLSFGPLLPTLFNGFLGVTDAAGYATASLLLPPFPGFVGVDVTASFVTIDFSAPFGIGRIAPPKATKLIAPPPAPTAVAPSTGPTTGGTVTTISGTGLEGVAWVRFGTKFASAVALGPGGLSATTPAGLSGTVDVAVVRPDGSEGVLVGGFEFLPPVTISNVAPSVAAAGATVTISGSGFNGGSTVAFAGVPASVSSATPTQIVCVVPPGVPCDAPLVVASLGGLSATTTFNASPAITGTLLAVGTSAGGASFFVFGSGFASGTTATVGGAPATIVSNVSGTLLIVAPPGTPGTATVVVSSPVGCSASTTYLYL